MTLAFHLKLYLLTANMEHEDKSKIMKDHQLLYFQFLEQFHVQQGY